MSRTIKDIKISGRTLPEVKSFILDWLQSNGFKIYNLASKGRIAYIRAPYSFLGAFIKPHRGAIVAAQVDMTGCFVFELSLKETDTDTDVHGEFYTAGELFFIGALDLKPNSGLLGKIPREAGYQSMTKFLRAMNSYSAT